MSARRWLRRRLPGPVVHRLSALRTRLGFARRTVDRALRTPAARLGRARGHGPVLSGTAWSPRRASTPDHADALSLRAGRERATSIVGRILEGHDIDHVVLPAVGASRPRIVTARRDEGQVLTALRQDLPRTWWARPLQRTATAVPADAIPATLTGSAALSLFPLHVAPDGTVLAGAKAGALVEFWDEVTATDAPRAAGRARAPDGAHDPGTLTAPRPNRVAEVLTAPVWQRAQATRGHRLPESPLLLEHREPIDAVYTWVNDSDPLWQRRFRDAVSHLDTAHHHETSWAASRFAERDELRYSLRSLEMYANWVNHIFIVTDQQVPSWLVEDHPRITVIDHAEIFDDPDALPVFNSHAIESRLHHIPGLAERYLYLNDDVFFGSPVIPDQFFTSNGIAKFFLSDRPIGLDPVDDRDLPVSAAAKNNRSIIERLFEVTVTQKFQHTPHPQLRAVLEEMEQRLAEEFAAVARSQFRSPQDISVAAALHHYYAYATGRAVPGTLNYQFLELSEPDTVMELRKLALRRHLEVFCLNDTMSTGAALDRQRDVIREFCEQYYPVPSSFEKP